MSALKLKLPASFYGVRGENDSEPAEPPDNPSPAYRVICISLYHDDIAALADRVEMLKTLGWSGANKSHLIRLALSRLDANALREIAAEQRSKR